MGSGTASGTPLESLVVRHIPFTDVTPCKLPDPYRPSLVQFNTVSIIHLLAFRFVYYCLHPLQSLWPHDSVAYG